MALLLFYLLLALGVSFVCSVCEAVLLSVRPSYIEALGKDSKTGKILKGLIGNLDRPLAAILTANTFAHTIGAAGVGAMAAKIFGDEYLGIVSGILTLLILVLSEIIPKTLGAVYWRQLAPVFGRLIYGLMVIFTPFVWLSEKLTRLIAPSGSSAFTFSREEVNAMLDIGADEGVLDRTEHTIACNLMKLHQLKVRDIMTPRTVMVSAAQDMTVQGFFDKYAQSSFSRIPIYGSGRDEVSGYVLKTDLLIAQAKDEFDRKLGEFKRDFVVIPENLNAQGLYERMMREKVHICLVVDEYGSVQGLVSLEDVVETLIGLEITDEMDKVADMQALARDRWRDRMQAMGVDPDSFG